LVSFVRIRAFQWVTANPNKKIFPLSGCVQKVSTVFPALFFSPLGAMHAPPAGFVDWAKDNTDSAFRKGMQDIFVLPGADKPASPPSVAVDRGWDPAL
jgi:hypothetical protein